ncbi:MAG: threonine--tRNA ligase [Planctomycetaceae bacterium]|nr:threonine--tRNA ligase [Planctomycetaceae bacterium]
MLKVNLPDGKSLDFSHRVRAADVAAQIGPRLAKATLAAEVDGQLVGAAELLPAEGQVSLRLVTAKDPEALGLLRHSCAHIMARAVMRLFKGVQLAFGPTVAEGFYYDFDMEHKLSEEDFPKIEAEMARIVKEDEAFERLELGRQEAIDFLRDLGQSLKVEHLQEGLSEESTVSFYRQGEFIDLCRGPHVPRAGAIGAFKLLSVAGAYWKGDSSRQQLQRLYGTAFFTKQQLDDHLRQLEEAKRRDHRVIGKQLELFFIDPDVGSGLVFWLPKGAVVRHELEGFLYGELISRGYQPVNTPVIGNVRLYQTSGHYPYYADSQFPPLCLHPFAGAVQELLLERGKGLSDDQLVALFEKYTTDEVPARVRPAIPANWGSLSTEKKLAEIQAWMDEQDRYLLRPMNCPHHVTIYKSKPRSYRELPLRLAEFGTVHRFEQSGELNGMTRVRGFTQDDAHIFCTEEQVADEFRGCLEMTKFVLTKLGLSDYRVRLGFRDPASDKYVGSAETWNRAEAALEQVCRQMDLPDLHVEHGEAAFYGPKADFIVTDCIGRPWQLGTVQLDYNLPSRERFNLEYIGADNAPHQPVMIHRAPFGSFERFVGMLIEHFAGAFPLWLAPEQVRVMVVSQKVEEYGRSVERQLIDAGFRVTGDYRAEKIGAKIRDAQLGLIPYMFVVGGREAEEGKVAVRDRIAGDLGAMPIAEAIERLRTEVREKTIRSK